MKTRCLHWKHSILMSKWMTSKMYNNPLHRRLTSRTSHFESTTGPKTKMHTSWIIWEKRKFLREQRKHSNLNAFLKIANRVNVLVDQCTFNVTRDWYGQWLVDTKMCAIKTIVRQTDMHFVRDSAKQVKKGRAHCPFFGPPYPFFGDPALFYLNLLLS